jgi:hypothetical protein
MGGVVGAWWPPPPKFEDELLLLLAASNFEAAHISSIVEVAESLLLTLVFELSLLF